MKFYFFLFLGLLSFNIGDQRKIISDDNYSYEFYVSLDKISNYKIDRSYFWYKSQGIHSSVGFSNGELLNGSYIKSSRENNIVEQGYFNAGLKNNVWREWYENGNIKSVTNWNQGFKVGDFIEYSIDGKTIIKGRYKNDKKHGYWIKPELRDTLFYRKGLLVEKKILDKKNTEGKINLFFKKLFSKKENDESNKSTDKSEIKKESFLKRLFSKKDDPDTRIKKKGLKKEGKVPQKKKSKKD